MTGKPKSGNSHFSNSISAQEGHMSLLHMLMCSSESHQHIISRDQGGTISLLYRKTLGRVKHYWIVVILVSIHETKCKIQNNYLK